MYIDQHSTHTGVILIQAKAENCCESQLAWSIPHAHTNQRHFQVCECKENHFRKNADVSLAQVWHFSPEHRSKVFLCCLRFPDFISTVFVATLLGFSVDFISISFAVAIMHAECKC